MLCDTSNVYCARKKLKDVRPGETFVFSLNGHPHVRIGLNSDFTKFMLMMIYHNDCYYPKEEEMEKDVYMVKAMVKISILENKKEG